MAERDSSGDFKKLPSAWPFSGLLSGIDASRRSLASVCQVAVSDDVIPFPVPAFVRHPLSGARLVVCYGPPM